MNFRNRIIETAYFPNNRGLILGIDSISSHFWQRGGIRAAVFGWSGLPHSSNETDWFVALGVREAKDQSTAIEAWLPFVSYQIDIS